MKCGWTDTLNDTGKYRKYRICSTDFCCWPVSFWSHRTDCTNATTIQVTQFLQVSARSLIFVVDCLPMFSTSSQVQNLWSIRSSWETIDYGGLTMPGVEPESRSTWIRCLDDPLNPLDDSWDHPLLDEFLSALLATCFDNAFKLDHLSRWKDAAGIELARKLRTLCSYRSYCCIDPHVGSLQS